MTNQDAIKILKPLFEQCKGKNECLGHIEHFFTKNEEEALDLAIKALEQRWIPVSERLPEEDGEYLCTIQTRSIYTDKVIDTYINFCDFMDGGWGVFDDETVVAWMPLPEPYKAESEVQECR